MPFTQSPVLSPSASSLAAAGGYETVTTYDQQGFPTVVVQPAGFATASKSYDVHGSLITAPPATPSVGGAKGVADAASTSPHVAFATGGASSKQQHLGLALAAMGLFALVF